MCCCSFALGCGQNLAKIVSFRSSERSVYRARVTNLFQGRVHLDHVAGVFAKDPAETALGRAAADAMTTLSYVFFPPELLT